MGRAMGILALAALLLVPAGAHAATRNAACAHAQGDTLVQNGTYRVYQRVKNQPKKYYTSLTSVYSCKLSQIHFKKHLIAKWGNNLDGTETVLDGELAGSFALLRIESETGVSDEIGLMTSDLRKGGSRHFFPPGDQVLGESWLASGGGVLAVYGPGEPSPTLHAFDSAGDHTLATGAFSEPGVSSKHAFWFESGILHSFPFAGSAATAPNKARH